QSLLLLQRMVKARSSLSGTTVVLSSHQGVGKCLLMRLAIFQLMQHALPRWDNVREPCWTLTFRGDKPLNAGVQSSKLSGDRDIFRREPAMIPPMETASTRERQWDPQAR